VRARKKNEHRPGLANRSRKPLTGSNIDEYELGILHEKRPGSSATKSAYWSNTCDSAIV
jgi:hypothetical protein